MSSYSIDTQIDKEYQNQAAAPLLRQAALAALAYARQDEPCELTVVVTSDDALRELNCRFLGIDRPTDVLAFPDDTGGPFVGAPGQPRYLGDVVISLPTAQEQAREASHDPEVELQLLVVHGVLHLLGYDDVAEDDRAAMWSAQQQILKELGVHIHPPE